MEVRWLQLICVLATVGQRSSADPLHSMPGSYSNVSGNDHGVLRALRTATWSFNNRSNDMFLFRVSSVREAQRQIVKGFHYVLDFNISRTVCRKGGNNDLVKCSFQPSGPLQQTFRCHADVWTVPWINQNAVLGLLCGDRPPGGDGDRGPQSS
ncbi:cystatin-F [Salarias fasciatus]|uniref:Cystatin-F-like n=1 Tax=Salarias fasciatus TaxID=181472 RepID=A0A672GI53_SALFA|nr:cystatin-F-like [Salarias fasciatus]